MYETCRLLNEISHPVAIQWLPMILDFLTHRMVKCRADAAYSAFIACSVFLARVELITGQSYRNVILTQYLTHRFTDHSPEVYTCLPEMWLQCLSEQVSEGREGATRDGNNFRNVLAQTWFWSELIIKSLALSCKESPLPVPKLTRYLSVTGALLKVMVSLLVKHRSLGQLVIKRLIESIALFFCDLFSLLDKSHVFYLLNSFLAEWEIRGTSDDSVLVDLKTTFYKVLFDNEYFLNLFDFATFDSNTVFANPLSEIESRFPFIKYFSLDYCKHLRLTEREIRNYMVNLLRHFTAKVDFDATLSGIRHSVALMFLHVIPQTIAEYSFILKMDEKSQRTILINFFWVVHHTPRIWLRALWKTLPQASICDFLNILILVIRIFKYHGVKKRRDDSAFDSILAPEMKAKFVGQGDGVAEDAKTKLEKLNDAKMMRSQRLVESASTPGKATLREARSRAGATLNRQNNNAIPGVGGTLREKRIAQMNKTLHTSPNVRVSSTGTVLPDDQDVLLRLVKLEGELNAIISRTVVSVMIDFLSDHLAFIKSEVLFGKSIMSQLLDLSITFLSSHQTNSILCSFFAYLAQFLSSCGALLFRELSCKKQVDELAAQLFRLCTFKSTDVKKMATTIIYLLVRINFDSENDLKALQVVDSKLINTFRLCMFVHSTRFSRLLGYLPIAFPCCRLSYFFKICINSLVFFFIESVHCFICFKYYIASSQNKNTHVHKLVYAHAMCMCAYVLDYSYNFNVQDGE